LKRRKRMSLIKIESTPMSRSRGIRFFLWDLFNTHNAMESPFVSDNKKFPNGVAIC